MSSFFPMKWEAGGGEEREGGGEEGEEDVWEVSSSDDMLITSYSRTPDMNKNMVILVSRTWEITKYIRNNEFCFYAELLVKDWPVY